MDLEGTTDMGGNFYYFKGDVKENLRFTETLQTGLRQYCPHKQYTGKISPAE